MSCCPYCGGVIGRDCFNVEECGAITADMQQASVRITADMQQASVRDDRVAELEAALSEKDTALREAQKRAEAAEAEIERMTPQFVAYEYLESPAGREIAEAAVAELRKALEWMRDRDNENGSLPPAYRSKIDSALTPTKEASDD